MSSYACCKTDSNNALQNMGCIPSFASRTVDTSLKQKWPSPTTRAKISNNAPSSFPGPGQGWALALTQGESAPTARPLRARDATRGTRQRRRTAAPAEQSRRGRARVRMAERKRRRASPTAARRREAAERVARRGQAAPVVELRRGGPAEGESAGCGPELVEDDEGAP